MILLDTHVALWWFADSPRLGDEARDAIANAPVAWVSIVSGWEVAIKTGIGKLRIPGSFVTAAGDSGLSKLGMEWSHVAALSSLPMHHRDPFDRMLIAQAQVEDLTLVTSDRKFERYDVAAIWS